MLNWRAEFDDNDNSILEAASCMCFDDEGTPMHWRLTQQIFSNKLWWTNVTSDVELYGDCEVVTSLEMLKVECQKIEDMFQHESVVASSGPVVAAFRTAILECHAHNCSASKLTDSKVLSVWADLAGLPKSQRPWEPK